MHDPQPRRWALTVLAALALTGCGSTPDRSVSDASFTQAVRSVRAEPWSFVGRFANWHLAHVARDARDYIEPGTNTGPETGPILISEEVSRGTPPVPLRQIADQYRARPNGRVGTVWVDAPDLCIFEGFYDARIGGTDYPFHAVVRLSPRPGTDRLAVLTYTWRIDAGAGTDVPSVVADLRRQSLKPPPA